MPTHELRHVIEAADSAINSENFDALMNFYSDDATLVIRPGLNATGKEQIRKAFVAIAEHFNHSLVVRQGDMHVIEGGDTALVVARTLLSASQKSDSPFSMERNATYVFKKALNGEWRCVIDNSYGTELLIPVHVPTLHLVCGKIAAGKSTLANRLSNNHNTVLVREDEWLASLYPAEIKTLADYVRCTRRLRTALGYHIEALLRVGLSVVLDFPANTPGSRQWMRELFEKAGVAHQLHYLDVPDDICKARLHLRNADGSHQFNTSDAEFDEITRHFVPPSPDEGFNVIVINGTGE